MADYNYQLLQPTEFEDLARDILQVKEGIFIESFADGKDGGIDFRYSTTNDKSVVVQVKRYKDADNLVKKLKNDELPKVKKINPNRYIVITSCNLSPNKKEQIKKHFNPYIKNTADIICEKDLNNLLGSKDYSDVIHKNPKLWFASTIALEEIFHKEVLNWSDFSREKIKEDVKHYVTNPSFTQALNVLKKNHFVIISGIPGIGKTTLARMLVYHLLKNGVEQFIYINKDLDQALSIYTENKTQVYFFDDFLGRNSFNDNQYFDKELNGFIDLITSSSNKYLIMTTREYILSDASLAMEEFSIRNRIIAKCVITLEHYKRPIRAKILRNHLSDSNIPSEYLIKILENKSYLIIINHKNFNPRIIQAFINNKIWETCNAEDFTNKMVSFFDKPLSVWDYAYNGLSELSKSILLVLATMGNYCQIEDLGKGVERYTQAIGLRYFEDEWMSCLKILSDCFIITTQMGDYLTIAFHNPSIYDFLISHLEQRPKTIRILLENSYYSEQCFRLFTDSANRSSGYNSTIVLTEEWDGTLSTLFNRIIIEKNSCRIIYYWEEGYLKPSFDKILFLTEISRSFPTFCRRTFFIEKHLLLDDLKTNTVYDYKCELLKCINWSESFFAKEEAIDLLNNLEKLYTHEYVEYIKIYNYLLGDFNPSEEFLEEMEEICKADIEEDPISDEKIDDLEKDIYDLAKLLPNWDSSTLWDKLDEIRIDDSNCINSFIEQDEDSERIDKKQPNDEEAIIINEMESLRDEL